jgi:hypothetical protein
MASPSVEMAPLPCSMPPCQAADPRVSLRAFPAVVRRRNAPGRAMDARLTIRVVGKGDSTDAPAARELSTGRPSYPADSTDAQSGLY